MGIFAIQKIIDKQVIEISKILDKDEGCCPLTQRMNTKFVLGELKEKYVKKEKDNKQTLLTEHCESFAFWLGMSCGYAIRFNEKDLNGNMILKDAVNLDNFQQMKTRGEIIDYEVDDFGVKIVKSFDLTSVSL